jgi:hypothetical protein
MTASLSNITFDCHDPLAMAAFWAAVLGRPVDEGASAYFCTIDHPGTPSYFFAKVPEGKAAKNRMHLDLAADDPEAEVQRLVGLGAAPLADRDEYGHRWTVLQDIEGNEFWVG